MTTASVMTVVREIDRDAAEAEDKLVDDKVDVELALSSAELGTEVMTVVPSDPKLVKYSSLFNEAATHPQRITWPGK